MSLRINITGPLLLSVLALLVPTVQLIVGVPMVGAHRAHDGAFAVSTLVQYLAEMRAGHLLPNWAAGGFGGLGSPIFFFYPPGAYFVASLIAIALPGLPAASIVGLAQILFRLGALATCFAWLRHRTTIPFALTGSALYALMPWVCTFNPQIRLDFAECAAAAIVPLVFWAIDAARERGGSLILAVAASVFVLSLVHLPSLVATSGLAVVYAAARGTSWAAAGRQAVSTIVGITLGMGLAGWYLLPAIGLLHEISTSALWDPVHQPAGHFILGPNTFHRSFILVNLGLLVPEALVALTYGALILERKHAGQSLLLQGGRRQPGRLGSAASERPIWALGATFFLAAFMAMPLSAPLWAIPSPLRMVQFPGRFVMPASLLAAALIASVLPFARPALGRLVFGAGLLLGAGAIVLAVRMGDADSPGSLRTTQALSQRLANAPEYVPAAAASHGWLATAQQGGISGDRANSLVSACVQSRPPFRRDQKGALAIDLAGCHGPTVLPQFYFPGWAGRADGHRLTVTPDPMSGLVEADIPAGTKTLTLRRRRLPIEQRGVLVSLVALLIAALFGLNMVRRALLKDRPRRNRQLLPLQRNVTR